MQFTLRGTQITVTPLLLVAVALGVAVAGYGGYDYIQQSNAVTEAVAVETTVSDTAISSSEGRSLYYRVTVEHTYQYRGTEYTSEQVFPGTTSPMYTVRGDAQHVLEQYEPDATTTAYVNPDAPRRAFLERQTTLAPFKFVGFGGLIVLLTTLHAVGTRTPGRNTELRPETEREPTRYETLFGGDRDTVNRLSKRLLLMAPVVFLGSLVGTVVLAYTAESSSIQADPTDPVGLMLLVTFVAALASITGLVLYGLWTFTEYRRLRERIPEPKPPSPFRHPSRLVTILSTSDGLDTYGQRVKLTGLVVTAAAFLAGVVVFILVTAS